MCRTTFRGMRSAPSLASMSSVEPRAIVGSRLRGQSGGKDVRSKASDGVRRRWRGPRDERGHGSGEHTPIRQPAGRRPRARFSRRARADDGNGRPMQRNSIACSIDRGGKCVDSGKRRYSDCRPATPAFPPSVLGLSFWGFYCICKTMREWFPEGASGSTPKGKRRTR